MSDKKKAETKRAGYATRAGRTPIGVTVSPEEHASLRILH